ncbi:S8 family serine peptidase [cf. Phormidesmis sp. LEGE 11477]|uniref:S8 family serine peptidase n=1 Tax=cf. Phormidesmis sp. LEGE 11477 TaxID=1828680 RepID=UPI0018822F1D|nr:S8 family serine peptidase [cf. Phormidesmis sp. LEGE 11477]MBE9060134.1 S8 family serine peptidase [cf. Phormidesmis sp. LEGE 11477]
MASDKVANSTDYPKRGLGSRLSGLGLSLGALAIGVPALALSSSVGSDGIDARRLQAEPYNLTGRKIAIGQVEIGRPSQFGIDKIAVENSIVRVGRVFELDGPAIPDESVDGHAANVASVMISQDKTFKGVAPNAVLYSDAIGNLTEFIGQNEECLASQHIALQNSGDVRAMNFSFGEPLSRDPRPGAMLDGNALLTQCIDWSSRVHKLLYVIAGNQGRGGIPIPTDNFNGINVAYSRRIDGRFVRLDRANLTSEPAASATRGPDIETNVGLRRSINLVAPGREIEMFDPDGQRTVSSGTSFAAPHVVATIALLQEFGDRQFRAGAEHWSLDSREPLVMKSVILNAADKLQDPGDGSLLGMARTLLDEGGKDWTESDAYTDQTIPLHVELGTGHLNAFRAYEQLAGGQWQPGESVPEKGWSYSALAEAGGIEDYIFEQPLKGGSYLNATLSWERIVELNSTDEYFDVGESFTGQPVSNLDLYLLPADTDNLDESVWSSVSDEDSLEHIFIPIPETGRYKLRVIQKETVLEEAQPYALAWWAQTAD